MPSHPRTLPRRQLLFAAAALALAVLVLYAPVRTFDFVALDDDDFVTENPAVRAGLTLAGVRWSFTAVQASNWQPVTWWSHMIDVNLFGMDAGRHHLVSAGLHALNAALLLLLLHRLTGALLPSLLAAALFALHPLRVESVAWVSERKDVLSAAFWLLSTHAYVGWCRQRSTARYGALLALMTLGLMAKPMLVTLPFTLLLLDAWPLGRAVGPGRASQRRLVLEKTPLFALAAAGAAVAILAQGAGGTLATLEDSSFAARIGNALVGYAWYAWRWLWPANLTVLRLPPEQGWPAQTVLFSALLLIGCTLPVVAAARRRPYLAAGWFWFLVTLLPVIGLVQVGSQTTADRYSYIPQIGLAIAASWAATGIARRLARPRLALIVIGLAAAAALASATAQQLRYWENSEQVFSRAVAIAPRNFFALNNLGSVYASQQRWAEAAETFRRALRVMPDEGYPRFNLGIALAALGRPEEAVPEFEAALRALTAPAERARVQQALADVLSGSARTREAPVHPKQGGAR